MVDIGATHSFMTTGLEKEVGLELKPKQVDVKEVNSRARVSGLEHVHAQIADWKGCLDSIEIYMNYFEIISGQEFLNNNKEIVVPFCDEIMLVGDT